MKSGAKPTPLKKGRLICQQACLGRNQTSSSDPQSRQHLFPQPRKTQNLAVCEQLCLGGFI